MTEISKAAKAKAVELVDAERLRPPFDHPDGDFTPSPGWRALARVMQEHSDVVKGAYRWLEPAVSKEVSALQSLILPDEPEMVRFEVYMTRDEQMACIRRALDEGKRIKIVEADHD